MCYMQGQTDLNPTSAIGKLSQVVFAIISPGRVVANIVAGAIAEAGAQQAGDMMQVNSPLLCIPRCFRASTAAFSCNIM